MPTAPELRPENYFDMTDPEVRELFQGIEYVWDLLPQLSSRLESQLPKQSVIRGTVMSGAVVADTGVVVEEGAIVEPGTFISGPCYIGRGASVRHGAYIRGSVLMMEGSMLGHAGEAKNSVLLPEAKAPHFAYVGDSILGARVNLGAGTKLSNLAINSDMRAAREGRRRPTISVWNQGVRVDTRLSKLGSVLGDDTSTGCNSVMNPGTLIGPGSLVYPNAAPPRGVYPPQSIIRADPS